MNGHDWDDIHATITEAIAVKGKPSMIIAHTVKGKGNAAVENTVASRNIKVGDKSAYAKYMDALGYTCSLPYED